MIHARYAKRGCAIAGAVARILWYEGMDMKKATRILSFVLVLALFVTVAPVRAQRDSAPARGNAAMDLAVLVDDSLQTSVSLQLEDVKAFVRELPVTTRVAVAYSSNGVAFLAQDFTTDHERAAAALRMPRGSVDGASGLYESLRDLRKRWPATGNRRAVLLVSSGIDLLRGVFDSNPGVNPDLQAAIHVYRGDGIAVYAIYASNAGRLSRNSFLVLNGQSCLTRMAAETGGEAYFSGSQTPISFRPFLESIRSLLFLG